MTDKHKVSKEKVAIQRGSLIKLDSVDYLLKEFISNSEVILKRVDDNTVHMRKLSEVVSGLIASDNAQSLASDDVLSVPDHLLKKAKQRLAAIQPLLNSEHPPSTREIKIQAVRVNVHYTTLYRWLKAYTSTRSLVSLLPQKRGWSKTRKRVDDEVDKIIHHCIENYYLTKARLTPKTVYLRITEACNKAKIAAPSQSTVYRRIGKVPEERRLRARGHSDLADNRFSARAGKFPGADTILSVIQIDHTPLDIIIVDDEHRESIKRVWLTLAIDVFSRMVTGFYLSLDAPSTTSVAMCLSHSILPKSNWLAHLEIDLDWMVWGVPKKVHVDNGADFTSDTLRIGCMENNINLEFRPVAKPQYGGHIERLLGTFQINLKDLDGKTFNSPKRRGKYDSEKNAVFDFDSLEKWLTNAIIKYHHEKHDVIGVPPATKWMMAVEGELEDLPRGWPDVPIDPKAIELSFMPHTFRTIRSQGIVWDGIYYFSDNIRSLIGSVDPETRKPKKYIVRRDPRNITCIWVYDDQSKYYLKVPFADPTLSFRSIWDLNETKAHLKRLGQTEYNEGMLSRAYDNMRAIEDDAKKTTKAARRKAQRNRNHYKAQTPADHFIRGQENQNILQDTQKPVSPPLSKEDELWDDNIESFEVE